MSEKKPSIGEIKLPATLNFVLLFTMLGGILPVRFDGKKFHHQSCIQFLSAVFLLVIIGGYIVKVFFIQKQILSKVNIEEIINIILDTAQFIGSLCCFTSAIIYQRLFRESLNRSITIFNKFSSHAPTVWQVVLYIVLESTEFIYPPRSVISALGKLQTISSIVVFTTVMIILEKTFEKLNEKIETVSHVLQKHTTCQELYKIYRDEPCMMKYVASVSLQYENTHWTDFKIILRELHDIMKNLNSISGILLICNIMRCFFFFTINLYRLIIRRFPMSQFFWTYLSFQAIVFLCQRFESLQRQVTLTKSILNEVDLSLLDDRSQAEVKLLLLQTENYSWNIDPLGMFHMDFTVVLSIIMTTLTYIILLKQIIGKQSMVA